jgi:hypothetical protein
LNSTPFAALNFAQILQVAVCQPNPLQQLQRKVAYESSIINRHRNSAAINKDQQSSASLAPANSQSTSYPHPTSTLASCSNGAHEITKIQS